MLAALLGDGHSSRGGAYRVVVEKGIRWVRGHLADASDASARAVALLALTEAAAKLIRALNERLGYAARQAAE